MSKNYIFLFLFCSSFLVSSTLNDIKQQIFNNNQDLKIIQDDITISKQNELLSTKWKNMVLGFGVNDLLINDFTARDKEAMQTQFITISQVVPTSGKLEYKEDIANTQSDIYKLLLKDKRSKYNSILISNLNEYIISKRKIAYFTKLQNGIKRIKKLQMQKFKLTNIGQVDILKNDTKYLKLEIKKQKLLDKLNIIKIEIENITYVTQNEFQYDLPKYILEKNINIKKLIENNNMYKALKKGILKSKQNVSLQKAMHTSDIKVKVGYYQREEFDDYLAFSIAYPLSIYGTEDIKIKKANIQYKRKQVMLKQFENKFKIKIKILIQNMQTAYKNYDYLKHKIIIKQRQIAGILSSQGINSKINTIEQIKNNNAILFNELKALDELDKFYKAQAKLMYYKGESL